MMNRAHRVVIIGAGFGGLYAARRLADQPDVEVLLVDRQNFHTFTPLLYQVATSALDPSEIAYPIRTIFRKNDNVRFLLGEVTAINPAAQTVSVRTNGGSRDEPYDTLILAAGSVTHFFGNDTLARNAFELKTLADAVTLRNHILKLFEKAAWIQDDAQRDALTTMVVVGGGPTGLETAGALYELYNHVLGKEYPGRQLKTRVVLVEASDRLLAPYPGGLQQAALEQVEALGVEVIFNNPVTQATADAVYLRDGTVIPTHTLVWSAGIKANPLAGMLGVPLAKGGLVPVAPTMQVIGREHIYAVGDIAYLEDQDGEPYAAIVQVARQQAILAAKNILRVLRGEPPRAFRYREYGVMATIGRSRAVAWLFKRIPLRGFVAWLAWVWLHLVMLMGFRNRLNVFVNWVWNYLTYDRSVRIILEHEPHRVSQLALNEAQEECEVQEAGERVA